MKTLLPFLSLFTPFTAWAHPGEHHDNLLATLTHLLSEPDHLALALLALAIGIAGAKYTTSRKKHVKGARDDSR